MALPNLGRYFLLQTSCAYGTTKLELVFLIPSASYALITWQMVFLPRMDLPLLDYQLRLKTQDGRPYVFDPIRKSWVLMTPEEHVRQRLICHFIQALGYPSGLIAIEKVLMIGGKRRRFDIVVYQRDTHQPWLLVECKAPEIPITDATLQQLLQYHSQLQCRYWMMSNGFQHFCADAGNVYAIQWLDQLPAYEL